MPILTLHQKIRKVYEEVTSVVKDSTVPTGKDKSYDAVSHDAVTEVLHGPLSRHGIIVLPSIEQAKVTPFEVVSEYNGNKTFKQNYLAEIFIQITFINAEDGSDREIVKGYAYALDTSDKAVGKAFSMATKNAYLKVFMLESKDQEESRDYEKDSSYLSKKDPAQAPPAIPGKPKNYAPSSPAPKQANPDRVGISESQQKRLWAISNATGYEWVPVCKMIGERYGVHDFTKFKQKDYTEFCTWLENNPNKSSDNDSELPF